MYRLDLPKGLKVVLCDAVFYIITLVASTKYVVNLPKCVN